MGDDTQPEPEIIGTLRSLVQNPPDEEFIFTKIKKDIFHAFHMIPIPVQHPLRGAFLTALRDHLMRWDPDIKAQVDATCRKVFKLTFEQMLRKNPRFIAARTPRFVPEPSVLVPAISQVFQTYGNAIDAKTSQPLFSKAAWQKANAVLDLAKEGYLSDIKGLRMYEKSGIDRFGLQKWKCLRGTNKVEGGPHGDIYRKFGAMTGNS